LGIALKEMDFLGAVFGVPDSLDFWSRLKIGILTYSENLRLHKDDIIINE